MQKWTTKWAMEENVAKAKKRGYEEGFQISYEEGFQIGLEEGKVEVVEMSIGKLAKNGILSIEQIADIYEVPIDYVLKIKNRIF